MGMTDRQFDAYQQSLLQTLERIREQVEEATEGKKIKDLEQLIKNIETQLQRP